MRNAVTRFVFAAMALVLFVGYAGAQLDPAFSDGDQPSYENPTPPGADSPCALYVRYWLDATKRARDIRCVSVGEQWTTIVKMQQDFCEAATDAQRQARTQGMLSVMNSCSACSRYVDEQRILIASNILYRCGFGSPDGGRWSPRVSRDAQISACVSDFPLPVALEDAKAFQNRRDDINGMRSAVQACKLTHQPQGCLFAGCHSSNSSSSALGTSPKVGAGFEDTFQRLKPSKPSAKSGNDQSKPSGSINRRATARKGSNTSGNDLANPSGGESKAMTPGLLEGGGGFVRQGPGAAGAASGGGAGSISRSSGGGGGTVDYGGCASCGRSGGTPVR